MKKKITFVYSHLRRRSGGKAAEVRGFPTPKKNCFFLTVLKMVVGVGLCGGEAAKVRIYSDEGGGL
jgi:hypothetical protein